MSFASDLKKVTTIDDAQNLFEQEVFRISKMEVYRNSKTRFDNRLLKVQNDIYNYLNSNNIQGILCVYDYMDYSNIMNTKLTRFEDNDNYTREDAIFFRKLWLFLFLYGLVFVLFVGTTNYSIEPNTKDVSRETVLKQEEKVEESPSFDDQYKVVENDDEMVYNKYRGQNTTRKTLKEDENWVNRGN